MRWKVGEYVFDEGQKLLSRSDQETVLEPKSAALLAFFCRNPGRNIGRDELLEAVWYGQIVSDNSISRVVVLLRKALQDEDKARRYIATIPKLGYNFIAQVQALETTGNTSESLEQASPAVRNRPFRQWSVAALVLVPLAALLFVLFARDNTSSETPSPSVLPLTRLAVTQSNADISADGKNLIYSADTGNGTGIYLISDEQSAPQQISTIGEYADFGKWANRGEFVVYLYLHEGRCEFHKVEFVNNEPQPATVLYQCNNANYAEFAFSPDNSRLYFVERTLSFAPYSAFELDLDQQAKRRLSQPLANGIGNHFIDVHPVTGNLLLLSDQLPGKTTAYELNTVQDSFRKIVAFDYSLTTAIWSHKQGHIVHPSTHPSYQLLETNLNTGDSKVMVSDSRRIESPRRIPNHQDSFGDYLFTSYLYNRDIELSDKSVSEFNSGVMDYLPALSHDGTKLAFISKRSGYSKIWIKNLREGTLTSIEPQDRGRLFFSLSWSEDDSKILANTNTGIFVYGFESQKFLHEIKTALPAYAASWHDENTVSYSHFEEEHWHLYFHNLNSGEVSPANERWAFSVKNSSQHILVDQQFAAFRDDTELVGLGACSARVWRYRLRLVLDEDNIYCHAADSNVDLLRFTADMEMTRLPGVVRRYEYYSIVNTLIANTAVNSSHSDIMRTRFLK